MSYLKLPISPEPKRTLRVWATELRAKYILTEDDLRWRNFDTELTANGSMTLSDVIISVARYRIVKSEVTFELTASFTTGGVAASDIYFILPVRAEQGAELIRTPIAVGVVKDGTEVGGAGSVWTQDLGIVRRYDSSSWSLGTGRKISVKGTYTRE